MLPSLPRSFFRHMRSFFGVGFMVSVGYMDPGNWAADLGAGSQFGYALLFAVLLSSICAMVSAALGSGGGRRYSAGYIAANPSALPPQAGGHTHRPHAACALSPGNSAWLSQSNHTSSGPVVARSSCNT